MVRSSLCRFVRLEATNASVPVRVLLDGLMQLAKSIVRAIDWHERDELQREWREVGGMAL